MCRAAAGRGTLDVVQSQIEQTGGDVEEKDEASSLQNLGKHPSVKNPTVTITEWGHSIITGFNLRSFVCS